MHVSVFVGDRLLIPLSEVVGQSPPSHMTTVPARRGRLIFMGLSHRNSVIIPVLRALYRYRYRYIEGRQGNIETGYTGIWNGQYPGIPDIPTYFEGAIPDTPGCFEGAHTRFGPCPIHRGIDECRMSGIPGIAGYF